MVTVSDLSPINKDTIKEGDKVIFAKQNENTLEKNKTKKQIKKGSNKEPKIVKEKKNFIIDKQGEMNRETIKLKENSCADDKTDKLGNFRQEMQIKNITFGESLSQSVPIENKSDEGKQNERKHSEKKRIEKDKISDNTDKLLSDQQREDVTTTNIDSKNSNKIKLFEEPASTETLQEVKNYFPLKTVDQKKNDTKRNSSDESCSDDVKIEHNLSNEEIKPLTATLTGKPDFKENGSQSKDLYKHEKAGDQNSMNMKNKKKKLPCDPEKSYDVLRDLQMPKEEAEAEPLGEWTEPFNYPPSPELEHSNLTKVIDAAKKIEATLKYSVNDVIKEFNDDVYSIETIQEPLIQAGLIRMSGSFFPISVVQEIIPESILKLESFEKFCGTFLIKKIIRNTALTVEDIIKYVRAEEFTNKKLEETYVIISSFQSSPILNQGLETEVAQLEEFQSFEKGIKIVKSLAAQESKSIALQEVLNYLDLANFKNFDSPIVQMAFMKLAKRVSNHHIVQEILQEEIINDYKHEELLGFKVLAKVMAKNPYCVSNIGSFILAEDISKQIIKEEKAYIAQVKKESNLKIVAQEIVLHESDKNFIAMKTELSKFLFEVLEHRSESFDVPYSILTKYPHLDSIASQAAMLGFAAKLATPATVNNVLALELLKEDNVLPYVGFFAVKKVSENLSFQKCDVEMLIKESFYHPNEEKGNLVLWENVASFLQYGNIPTEYVTIEDALKKPYHEIAMKKIASLLNISSNVGVNAYIENIDLLKSHMKNLQAQILLTTVSEKMLKTPVTETILHLELTRDSPDRLPYFGFKALKTAIESTPLTICCDDLNAFLSIQDVEEEKLKSKAALLLNTAYSIRILVSNKL